MINGLPVDLVHTVSNSSKEDLIKFDAAKDGSKILMVPNGIDLGHYTEKETECQYQDFALFVGRLVEYKNLEVVIAAFSEVIKSLPTAQLVVVGDGPARPKLEKMVVSNKLSKNIKFMGYVSEENKAQLLRNCSMLVFPSLIEGFGLVILEAFAHRKPVLASDVKPINEIVKDKVNGLLIPPFDDSEWSKRILYLLNNKGVCKVMGWRGRFLVETKYELTRLSENIEAAYLKLVASRSMASDHANLYWYDGKTSTPTARSPV
jgi:glycosyltransferase involved in cell wall biosynthesis